MIANDSYSRISDRKLPVWIPPTLGRSGDIVRSTKAAALNIGANQPCGLRRMATIPPAEAEANYYAASENLDMVA